MIGTSAILLGTLTAIIYAAATGISDWSQLVVLAGIALVAIATMIAVDPPRRER
jgi:hypothetical protein